MSKLFAFTTALLMLTTPAIANDGTRAASTQPTPRSGGMMRYDANKDGAVDRDEWNAGQQARFRQLDADGDGKLNQDELFARARPAGNSVIPSDRQAARQSAYFQRLDADRDGAVTLIEFTGQGDRNFARCDLDRDDRIDTAECRQALQRPRAEQ